MKVKDCGDPGSIGLRSIAHKTRFGPEFGEKRENYCTRMVSFKNWFFGTIPLTR